MLTQIIKKIIISVQIASNAAITITITITISVQIASNAATTSMLVPVIKTLAIKLEVFAIWTFFLAPVPIGTFNEVH